MHGQNHIKFPYLLVRR